VRYGGVSRALNEAAQQQALREFIAMLELKVATRLAGPDKVRPPYVSL